MFENSSIRVLVVFYSYATRDNLAGATYIRGIIFMTLPAYKPCNWAGSSMMCCDLQSVIDTSCPPSSIPAIYPVNLQTKEAWYQYAARLMYLYTGERFDGLCEYITRPCKDCYSSCNLCFDIFKRCQCGVYLDSINLSREADGNMIDSIIEVKIDGVVLAPSAYIIEDYKDIVRIDGQPWPYCQDFSKNPDSIPPLSANTFQIKYVAGRMPPIDVQRATALLACQLMKACNSPSDCQLPSNVASVSRQGIAFDMSTVSENNYTGIEEIDNTIKKYNTRLYHGAALSWGSRGIGLIGRRNPRQTG